MSDSAGDPEEAPVDVIVMAGVPDTDIKDLESGQHAYPGTAVDLVKVLREEGLRVEWEHTRESRATVEHKAADVWIPILYFVNAATANGAGTLLAAAIMKLLGNRKAASATLHVEFERKRGDKRERFKATGPGDDVLKALHDFDNQ